MVFLLNFKFSLEASIDFENKSIALPVFIGHLIVDSIHKLSFDFSHIVAIKLILFSELGVNIQESGVR